MGNSWKVLVAERVNQEGLFFHLTQMKSCYISTLLFLFFIWAKSQKGTWHTQRHAQFTEFALTVYAPPHHTFI